MFFGEGNSDESNGIPSLGKRLQLWVYSKRSTLSKMNVLKQRLANRLGSRAGSVELELNYSCNHSGVTNQTSAPPPLHGSSATLI